jgi:hypothetical protein
MPSRTVLATAALFAIVLSGPAHATCGEECDASYASDIDTCKLQYGDDPADADDLATCISSAKDDYRSCLDDCAADATPRSSVLVSAPMCPRLPVSLAINCIARSDVR